MKLDLLAIAAHPDDVELTCGGTLLKATDQGYQTGILDLTAGEMGTRGTPETRLKESAKAAKILRVAHRENLRLPDANLEVTKETKLAVARRIRALKPHTVILPYWEGRHPDHYTAARLAYEGCFLAGLKQLPIEGEAFRPFKILYSTVYFREVRPTFVVDISKFFERRYDAILAYHSQFNPKARDKANDKKSKVDIPLDRLHHEVNLIARYYGQMAGVEYAEPFVLKEVMQVEDVVKLPVRSI
ncbi:MAG TPA: bacillithiol biosynthesis deacetylase BshB1 [Candidatus Acidoferrales bacterium]|jgi:bacillithiol biosynthesis deacetylase BshB1|nr:bacillithiol biosynthesis deacetylase BshB1 [Candidatus Acidoferrales bacterium]